MYRSKSEETFDEMEGEMVVRANRVCTINMHHPFKIAGNVQLVLPNLLEGRRAGSGEANGP